MTGYRTATAQTAQQTLRGLIWTACEALLATDPSVIESVTISHGVDDPESARFALAMARRLTEEYCLDVETRTNGTSIVLRVRRRNAPDGMQEQDNG